MLIQDTKFCWTHVAVVLSLNFYLVEPRVLLTFDSIMDALSDEADQLEEVQRHSVVVQGHGHEDHINEDDVTLNPNLSPLLQPSDKKIHHKTRPPVIGSLCDYEDYSKVFGRYYALPFLNFAERLYEHKAIEEELKQGVVAASTERAWSLCQFGGNMMECGEKRKCQCLNQGPPYQYIKRKGTGGSDLDICVGKAGSICFNDPLSPTECVKGLNCTHGYCGGLELAARTLSNFLGRAPTINAGSLGIVIAIILGLICNLDW